MRAAWAGLGLAAVALALAGCGSGQDCPFANPNDPLGVVIVPFEPADGATVATTVTFAWRLVPEITGKCPDPCRELEIFTDKGQDPLDGGYEDRFVAPPRVGRLTVALAAERYRGTTFSWAIRCGSLTTATHRATVR